MQGLDKLAHIGAHHFPVCPVGMADFVCDSCLVEPLLHQVKDFGADHIQAEHLAVVHVQQDSAICSLGPSDCVGDSEHWFAVSEELNLGCPRERDSCTRRG